MFVGWKPTKNFSSPLMGKPTKNFSSPLMGED